MNLWNVTSGCLLKIHTNSQFEESVNINNNINTIVFKHCNSVLFTLHRAEYTVVLYLRVIGRPKISIISLKIFKGYIV